MILVAPRSVLLYSFLVDRLLLWGPTLPCPFHTARPLLLLDFYSHDMLVGALPRCSPSQNDENFKWTEQVTSNGRAPAGGRTWGVAGAFGLTFIYLADLVPYAIYA